MTFAGEQLCGQAKATAKIQRPERGGYMICESDVKSPKVIQEQSAMAVCSMNLTTSERDTENRAR